MVQPFQVVPIKRYVIHLSAINMVVTDNHSKTADSASLCHATSRTRPAMGPRQFRDGTFTQTGSHRQRI
jgi:hypothetical protein